jgi:hypothetical protein
MIFFLYIKGDYREKNALHTREPKISVMWERNGEAPKMMFSTYLPIYRNMVLAAIGVPLYSVQRFMVFSIN